MRFLIICCDLEVADRRMTPAIKLVFAQAWHCQVVGNDIVTRQQKALSGSDFHRPDA